MTGEWDVVGEAPLRRQAAQPQGGGEWDVVGEAPLPELERAAKPQMSLARELELGVKRHGSSLGRTLTAVAGSPLLALDAAAKALTGKDTGASSWYAQNVFDAFASPLAANEAERAATSHSTAGTLINAAGEMGSAVPEMLMGGPIANAVKLAPSAATAVVPAIRDLLTRAFVGAQPLAVEAGIDKYAAAKARGASDFDAARAGVGGYAGMSAMGMAPMGRAGSLPVRVATGAASGPVVGAGAISAENLINAGNAQAQGNPLDPESALVNAVTGAIMHGVMGPRAPTPLPTPAQIVANRGAWNSEHDAATVMAERTVPPKPGSVADIIAANTGAVNRPESVAEWQAQQQAAEAARAKRAAELGTTFNGVDLPNDPPVPNSQEQHVRQVYEGAGVDPDSVANTFARARLADSMDLPPTVREGVAKENNNALAAQAFDLAARRQRQADADLANRGELAPDYQGSGAAASGGRFDSGIRGVTLLDARYSGGKLVDGLQVEVLDPQQFPPSKKGSIAVRDGAGNVFEVEASRLSDHQVPVSQRQAQDFVARSNEPPRGVGTETMAGEKMPRRSTDRIAGDEYGGRASAVGDPYHVERGPVEGELYEPGPKRLPEREQPTPREPQTYEGEVPREPGTAVSTVDGQGVRTPFDVETPRTDNLLSRSSAPDGRGLPSPDSTAPGGRPTGRMIAGDNGAPASVEIETRAQQQERQDTERRQQSVVDYSRNDLGNTAQNVGRTDTSQLPPRDRAPLSKADIDAKRKTISGLNLQLAKLEKTLANPKLSAEDRRKAAAQRANVRERIAQIEAEIDTRLPVPYDGKPGNPEGGRTPPEQEPPRQESDPATVAKKETVEPARDKGGAGYAKLKNAFTTMAQQRWTKARITAAIRNAEEGGVINAARAEELRSMGVNAAADALAVHARDAGIDVVSKAQRGPAPEASESSRLLSALKAAGGVSSADALDMTGDTAQVGNRQRPGLFSRSGMSADGVLEWAKQNGWLPDGADINDARALVRDALAGREVNRADSATLEDGLAAREEARWREHERRMAEDPEYRAQHEREAAQDMEAEAVSESLRHILDHEKLAKAYDADPEAYERAAAAFDEHNNPAQFMRDAEDIINGKRNAGRDRANETPDQGGAQDRAADQGAVQSEQGFGLEQHDAADLRAREEQRAAAERADAEQQRQLDQKARADAEVGGFQLTGSNRAADANPNQGDMFGNSDRARQKAEMEAIYGVGPIDLLSVGSTAELKKLAKAIRELFVGTDERLKENWHVMAKALRDVQDNVVRSGGIVGKVAHAIFDTHAGAMRNLAKRFDSPTMTAIIDHFSTQAGSDRATGETYTAAVERNSNLFLRRLQDALGRLQHDDAAMRQIANRVRTGSFDGSEMGKAAQGVSALLNDVLAYMQKAGVEVGEVANGYYPREFDISAIIKDGQTGAFVRALSSEYQRMGMAKADADVSARRLRDTLVYGDNSSLFNSSGGAVRTPFTKERVFGPDVDKPDHPLNKFLLSDPAENITNYITRAVRRAEIASRFGDRFEHWANDWTDAAGQQQKSLLSRLESEGAQEAVKPLIDFVASAAGLRNAGVSEGAVRLASSARTWGSLAFLEKATLSSLTEFITPAIRAAGGSRGLRWTFIGDAARSLHATIADLVIKSGNLPAAERRAFAEDLGLIASHLSDQISAARFSGGEPMSKLESHVLSNFFRRTGLTQWTEATRIAAIDTGRTFIRRLATQVADGDRLSVRYLKELGIPEAEAKSFAADVLARNGGRPGAADIADMGRSGDLYRTAVSRFLEQSIMAPNRTTKPGWMSHPLGSVIGQLQSFNYAFFDNVWKRNASLAKEALNRKNDYDLSERLRMLAPMLSMPALVGAAYAVGELRDEYLGDPNRRKEETAEDKMLKAASRGAPIAPLDPLINYVYGSRYQRGAVDFAAGPVLGTVGRGVDAVVGLSTHNSDNTNSQERKAAKAFYDMLIEPGFNLAAAALPYAQNMKALSTAVGTQVVGAGETKEKFVSAVAGPAPQKPGAAVARHGAWE